MTFRERMLRTMRFERPDRVPDIEFGAWIQTLERWQHEGMNGDADDPYGSLDRYFHTDACQNRGPNLDLQFGVSPPFEIKVLEDRGRSQIIQNDNGVVCEQLKEGSCIPRYIEFPIKNRSDWEKFRAERLDPETPERLPNDIEEHIQGCPDDRNHILCLDGGSIYGWIRNWMGVESLSLALYDDIDWVEEMMEHLTQLHLSVLKRLAAVANGRLTADSSHWWEDMCYNKGPLLSPKMFAKLMVPRYRRVTDYKDEELGTQFHSLDCDGNIHELVGLWLEGGINVMFPIEAAHTDAFRIRDGFGDRVAMQGGFDKRALIAGPDAIEAEFKRIHPLIDEGGFIPHTDHLVPPDVSLENYLYYRRKKCEIIGKEWIEPGTTDNTEESTA
jgi:hypothetical protein